MISTLNHVWCRYCWARCVLRFAKLDRKPCRLSQLHAGHRHRLHHSRPPCAAMLFQGGQGRIYADTLQGMPCAVKIFSRSGKRSAAASAQRAVSLPSTTERYFSRQHMALLAPIDCTKAVFCTPKSLTATYSGILVRMASAMSFEAPTFFCSTHAFTRRTLTLCIASRPKNREKNTKFSWNYLIPICWTRCSALHAAGESASRCDELRQGFFVSGDTLCLPTLGRRGGPSKPAALTSHLFFSYCRFEEGDFFREWMLQIAHALYFCHGHFVAHRDGEFDAQGREVQVAR